MPHQVTAELSTRKREGYAREKKKGTCYLQGIKKNTAWMLAAPDVCAQNRTREGCVRVMRATREGCVRVMRAGQKNRRLV